MSDRSPAVPLWPLLCGIMALLAVIASAAALSLYLRLQEYRAGEENMQRRYLVDTRQIDEEMKAAGKKLADESFARLQAEMRCEALQARVDELTRALAESQRKPGAPATP
jgi:hypothetical protein